MERLHINFANIHCDECENTVINSVSHFFKVIRSTSKPTSEEVFKLEDNEAIAHLQGNDFDLYSLVVTDSIKSLTSKLRAKGLQVLSWEIYKDEEILLDSKATSKRGLLSKFKQYKATKNHLKHCTACSDEQSVITDDSLETVVEKNGNEYRAVFTIAGMSCSSCVNSISEVLEDILGEKENSTDAIDKTSEENHTLENYSVNLIQHSCVVIIPNKLLINTIIKRIDELGFDCRLVEVLPVQRTINTKVTAVVGGITCAACASSIDAVVKELPFVLESGVNVVTKTAMFVLEDSHNLDELNEAIEDAGFTLQVVSVEKINYTSSKKKPRTINVKVDGIMCGHCPEVITTYLSDKGVMIQNPITVEDPFIKFTYIPSETSTIRHFLFDLNHLSATDSGYVIKDEPGTFTCTIIEEISMEEHLRKLTQKEVIEIAVRLLIAVVFAIPTLILGIIPMLLPKANNYRIWMEEPMWVGDVARETWVLLIVSTPVYFFAADIFHRKAYKEIKSLWMYKNSFKRRLLRFGSMNLLMSLGTSIAYIASIILLVMTSQRKRAVDMPGMPAKGMNTTYFDTVVFLTFFLLIGRLLEVYAKSKTAEAISGLSGLKSSHAVLVENGENVDVGLLEVGDLIRIVSGESPPVDCVISEGESEFDESALTGESTPVKHSVGHQIFSGTVNIGSTTIIAKIISLDGDSLIDQIVNTVRDGQLRKAPIERTADKLTSYFVPVITVLAILTWIIWLSLGLGGKLPDRFLDSDVGGWVFWSLEFSIAVFVIACPCGIGLAAPTALFVGSGLAAKNGILAKGGGVAFQDGASTNVICFDKTGTLTNGEVEVTNYAFVKDSSIIREFSFQVARDLELSSNHPLAKAVKKFVEATTELSTNKIPIVENIPGKGVKGSIVLNGSEDLWNQHTPMEAILGNESLLKDNNVQVSEGQQQLLQKWKGQSKSVILVAIKCELLFKNDLYNFTFMMAARDQIRPETKKVIKYLQSNKFECWMITGDNRITAQAIANEIGISNVLSEVLPNEKLDQIKKLQQIRGNVVAMVGDGINDAPALAAADVGIALSSGADLAVTLSDFILLSKSHPLLTLTTLFELSRVVFTRVKFNFGWSLVYNMIGIPIAAGVIYPYHNTRLSPVWASAAMAASSISVVLSSLALKLYRPKLKISKDDIEEILQVEVLEEFITADETAS